MYKIKVILRNGTEKTHSVSFGTRDIDIVAWLDETYGGYGWETYHKI